MADKQDKVPAILKAMDKINQDLAPIGKNQQGYGYKFRGIDDVLNALNPLFKKHKVIVCRRNLHSERVVREVEKGPSKDVVETEHTDSKEVTTTTHNSSTKQYVEVFVNCEYVFTSLEDGSEIVSEGFGEGQDSSGGDKASSMATSNSFKYVIFEMFSIATDEQRDSDQITARNADGDAKKAGTSYRKPSKKGEEDDVL